jgi:hypothetical protein
MANPKGNPDSLQPFTTDREEPLVKQIAIRITALMANELNELGDEKPRFIREAIQEKLDKRKADKSED